MNIILFDGLEWSQLLPLTYTRPVADLRLGIMTIAEKWERAFDKKISFITKDYLSKKYAPVIEDDNLLINGALLPNLKTKELLVNLEPEEMLLWRNHVIGVRTKKPDITGIREGKFERFKIKDISEYDFIDKVDHLWQLFQKNEEQLHFDFDILTLNKKSQVLSPTNTILGDVENIFVSPGAKIEAAIIDSRNAKIFIGENAEIMPGTMIKGSLYLGANAVIKMGAKIYGATSIGQYCKVGGEINNTVFHSYSNKAHDGFLGNAVIGQWCNIGADTNNSNLKNNYAEVKIWNYPEERFVNTGTQFCGLFMGDHSKTGINTMFNTGTVVGVSANIFGAGFPRTFIPSFAWGGNHGFTTFRIEKALETAAAMMKRRNIELTAQDIDILTYIYEYSRKYRAWEKAKK